MSKARNASLVECSGAARAGGPAGGGPLAFAHVLEDGTLDIARSSSNVLSVTRALVSGSTDDACPACGAALYCFDLGVESKNVIATVENSVVELLPPVPFPARGIGVAMVNATVQPFIAIDWGCSAATDAAVIVGARQGLPFYVEVN